MANPNDPMSSGRNPSPYQKQPDSPNFPPGGIMPTPGPQSGGLGGSTGGNMWRPTPKTNPLGGSPGGNPVPAPTPKPVSTNPYDPLGGRTPPARGPMPQPEPVTPMNPPHAPPQYQPPVSTNPQPPYGQPPAPRPHPGPSPLPPAMPHPGPIPPTYTTPTMNPIQTQSMPWVNPTNQHLPWNQLAAMLQALTSYTSGGR